VIRRLFDLALHKEPEQCRKKRNALLRHRKALLSKLSSHPCQGATKRVKTKAPGIASQPGANLQAALRAAFLHAERGARRAIQPVMCREPRGFYLDSFSAEGGRGNDTPRVSRPVKLGT
jgi:hypothetical protein